MDVLRVTYAVHHRPMGQFFLCGLCGCVFRMEWSQERVIEFIDAYKKKQIIWDPKHPLHYNKIKKQDAWEELAKEINRPVDECKKKMENLLSALRRENRNGFPERCIFFRDSFAYQMN